MKVGDIHNLFIQECRDGTIQRRSDKTIAKYDIALKLLLRWFPVSEVESITEDLLKQFFRKGEKVRSWKAASVITYRTSLSAFFQWCVGK